MGHVDFHVRFRRHGRGGSVVEGDSTDGSGDTHFGRCKNLLGAGIVIVVV